MKLFKFAVILSVLVFASAVAWAGNTPEYDAVGVDKDNFFAQRILYYQIITDDKPILEQLSAFDAEYEILQHPGILYRGEEFFTNAGQLKQSPCYPPNCRFPGGYFAALTDAYNEGTYEWWIVLQMKPESDINLNIYDCVLKHNETDLWMYADQTGRYRADWGELIFDASANPIISASVIPGPWATSGFTAQFAASGEELILDARTLPGLVSVPMEDVAYTSKGHFPEGLVLALPKTLNTNGSGQMEWNLKQGDVIHVKVQVPYNNTVDVWYGPASVLVKYIGIVNTEFFGYNTN
jgi:hypothetical protein